MFITLERRTIAPLNALFSRSLNAAGHLHLFHKGFEAQLEQQFDQRLIRRAQIMSGPGALDGQRRIDGLQGCGHNRARIGIPAVNSALIQNQPDKQTLIVKSSLI
jgi:hypothetical protein